MQYPLHSHNEVSMQRVLSVANASLLISVLVLAVTVLVCYPYAEFFSLKQQLVGHISIILSATVLKIAYVARCVAQYSLNLAVI